MNLQQIGDATSNTIYNRIFPMCCRTYKRYKLLGIIEGTRLSLAIYLKYPVRVSIPGVLHPIEIRAGTTDIKVFDQIFVDEDYNFPISIKPKLIIDGGANVGYASVYFANRFKEAHIIAIEPEKSNINLLKKNTCYYPNIEVIESAIWDENVYLKIKDVGLGEWAFMVERSKPDEPNSFRAITIQKLLAKSGYQKIDILKLDVEGSEKEIFSRNYEEWLGKVCFMVIELHDKMKVGCSNVFYSAIKNYNFKKSQRGVNIILERPKIKS